MRHTENLGLFLYDSTDKMNITGKSNSLNHNMELIDVAISDKVSKEEGKGLSSNDYTDEDKEKLAGLSQSGNGNYDDTEIKQSVMELKEHSVFYDNSDDVDEAKWLGDLLETEVMRLSLDCDEEGNLTLYYGDKIITSVQIVGGGGSAVEVIPCESIELNSVSVKLRDIDTSYILSATVSPITATQKVRWSTTDANIATVSNDGTVTLTGKAGKVTINAVCGAQSASCDITVVNRVTRTVYDFWTTMNSKGVVGGYEYIYINHLGNEVINTSDCYSAPKLPVIPGDKITGTFTSRGIPVCYYDAEGNIVWDALPYKPETSGKVVSYTVNSVVPEGVSYVKVSSMNTGGNIGTPYLTAHNIY